MRADLREKIVRTSKGWLPRAREPWWHEPPEGSLAVTERPDIGSYCLRLLVVKG